MSDNARSLLILLGIGMVYFMPSVSAYHARHRNVQAIFALNVFLGWTFIGWVIAYVWSLKKDPEPQAARLPSSGGTVPGSASAAGAPPPSTSPPTPRVPQG